MAQHQSSCQLWEVKRAKKFFRNFKFSHRISQCLTLPMQRRSSGLATSICMQTQVVSCFVFVQFLCTCNHFVCMHAQETRSSKKCRRQFVKKAPAIRECTRAVRFYSFAALNKNFSQQDWAKRKRDSLDEPQRQAKAEKLKNFKEV